MQAELRTVINEVLDFAAAMSPGLITEKNKMHILLHLPDHVERFGPALLFSTERYESFNHIFRLCSIHSNRQAPSRDIATAFAHQERCRHILTGGYWLDEKSHRWVCASPAVLAHLKMHPADARLLGVHAPTPPAVGSMRLQGPPDDRSPMGTDGHSDDSGPGIARPRRRPPAQSWTELLKGSTILPSLIHSPLGRWRKGATAVVQNGDVVAPGTEVLIQRRHIQQPDLPPPMESPTGILQISAEVRRVNGQCPCVTVLI